ncbi:MAG: DUF1553 domain-containing protein, partial [Planctomycetaceae bacterium]|nr:DUF1553 domain-containing protein [Planctomycetaceae bacterium]
INGGQGKPHAAVFALSEPLTSKTFTLLMLFERYYAAGIGRFRISVTTNPSAVEAPFLPSDVESALLSLRSLRARASTKDGHPAIRRAKTDLFDPQEQSPADGPNLRLLKRYFVTIAPELASERQAIESLRSQRPTLPTSLVMRERPDNNPRSTHRHHRGEFLQPKEHVDPGVPSFLPALPKNNPPSRASLAQWLVNPDNPLTARVTVNRHWAAFFGRGIVRTQEDFGFQGALPTHSELLNWLSVEFAKVDESLRDSNSGHGVTGLRWNLKRLHRLILTSATYQQSSRVTPELLKRDAQNELLACGPRFRVEAESVRDSLLSVSGLLGRKLGGPSVFPPQPANVTTEGTYGQLAWKVSEGLDRHRRSLYTFAKRTAPFAMFTTFDAPSGEACVVRREVSNTPLQALTLLNDVVFTEASQALGRQFATISGNDEARLAELFRRCLTRPPTDEEVALLNRFLKTQRERLTTKELDADKLGGSVEEAAWSLVSRALLNLDEAVTKN